MINDYRHMHKDALIYKPTQGEGEAAPSSADAGGERTESPARATYHHPDLRDALLVEAIRVIDTEGGDAVSIRQLAKTLGVSPGAPFRHFADKKALLTAVAEQATARLRAAVEGALTASPHAAPWVQLQAMGQAYLEWSRAHPSHFVVVSDRRLIDADSSASMRADNDAIRAHMQGLLEKSESGRAGAGVQLLLMRAMVYGLARMHVDGQLAEWSDGPADAQAVQNQALDAFMGLLSAYDGGHD